MEELFEAVHREDCPRNEDPDEECDERCGAIYDEVTCLKARLDEAQKVAQVVIFAATHSAKCSFCGEVTLAKEAQGHMRKCEKHPLRTARNDAFLEVASMAFSFQPKSSLPMVEFSEWLRSLVTLQTSAKAPEAAKPDGT